MLKGDREAFLLTIPSLYRGLVGRTFTGKATKRDFIKAKCLDCCAYEREEVANCTVVLCPLHACRPYPTKPRKSSCRAAYERASETSGDQATSES